MTEINQFYYYKESVGRYKVYDNRVSVGADHTCIADCGNEEWRAKIIVKEMNEGLPYRPDISYKDFEQWKENAEQ